MQHAPKLILLESMMHGLKLALCVCVFVCVVKD